MTKVAILLIFAMFFSAIAVGQEEVTDLTPTQEIADLQSKKDKVSKDFAAATNTGDSAKIEALARQLSALTGQINAANAKIDRANQENAGLKTELSHVHASNRQLAGQVKQIEPIKKDVGKLNDAVFGKAGQKGERSGGLVKDVGDLKSWKAEVGPIISGTPDDPGDVRNIAKEGRVTADKTYVYLAGEDGKLDTDDDPLPQASSDALAATRIAQSAASGRLTYVVLALLGLVVTYLFLAGKKDWFPFN